MYKGLNHNKLNTYHVVFIDKESGEQQESGNVMHLYESELVEKEKEFETMITLVKFVKVKK